MIHFDVMTGRGLGNNALYGGDRDAVERQTPSEHEALLDITTLPDYQRIMSTNPAALPMFMPSLLAQAETREAEFPKYWDDSYPRRDVSQSSSFIGPIDYDPYSDMAMVEMNGKVYPYVGIDPVRMAEWLNYPSMERYYTDFIKGK